MTSRRAALAVLGLEPGANSAEIDRAYRQLIKRHHPDREGGDRARAAEITRAYRELRGPKPLETLDLNPDPTRAADPSRWVGRAFVAGAAMFVMFALSGEVTRWRGSFTGDPAVSASQAAASREAVSMDAPLDSAAVAQGIADAVRTMGHDEYRLAEESRACHARTRRVETLSAFDRCAAFDRAVTMLQDRDPLRDRGPFSELAVTGRLVTAGTLFSRDYLAIEGRLHRIRLAVELSLAEQAAVPSTPPSADQRSVTPDDPDPLPEADPLDGAPTDAVGAAGSPPESA